jgi:hypothetical protein
LRKLDHLLAQLLARGNYGLDSVQPLPQVQESELCALRASILNPAAEGNLLALELLDIGEVGTFRVGGLEILGSDERELAVCVFGNVLCGCRLLLLALGKFTRFGSSLLLSL